MFFDHEYASHTLVKLLEIQRNVITGAATDRFNILSVKVDAAIPTEAWVRVGYFITPRCSRKLQPAGSTYPSSHELHYVSGGNNRFRISLSLPHTHTHTHTQRAGRGSFVSGSCNVNIPLSTAFTSRYLVVTFLNPFHKYQNRVPKRSRMPPLQILKQSLLIITLPSHRLSHRIR